MMGVEMMLKSMGIDPQSLLKYGEEAKQACGELLAKLNDIQATGQDTNSKVSGIYNSVCKPVMDDKTAEDYIKSGLVQINYNPASEPKNA